MGEVYRARDTKLNRDVALKVLPELLAHDPDRLTRFKREAQTLASLNHPHIAGIYGLEESGGVRAIVMELVEGDDLSQRIARGALPLDETLPIARQIAEALEAAHEQGIIHRDLKPANIKVRADGTVKVLDFGLAKAMEPSEALPSVSQSPTITTPAMTQAGVILGTAAYMSPQQAKGHAVDRRSDVWAFGAVLFEMLSGQRAFAGENVFDTVANVLTKEPDWERLPANVPHRVRHVIRACLQKNAKQRIGDVQDVRLALEGAFESTVQPTDGRAMTTSRRKERLVWLSTVILVTLLAAVQSVRVWWPASPMSTAPQIRFEMAMPAGGRRPRLPNTSSSLWRSRREIRRVGSPNSSDSAGGGHPSLSPDCRYVAMNLTVNGNRDIWLLETTRGVLSKFTTESAANSSPRWSPDGRQVVFNSNRSGVFDLYI